MKNFSFKLGIATIVAVVLFIAGLNLSNPALTQNVPGDITIDPTEIKCPPWPQNWGQCHVQDGCCYCRYTGITTDNC